MQIPMIVKHGDFSDPQVVDILTEHLAGMHANTPAGHVFALDLSGLQRPEITFLTAWEGDILVACGAIKQLAPDHGELKSMRTRTGHLRKGAATAILAALLDLARSRGYTRVSLETGNGPSFDAALALYRRHGFRNGEAFADYVPSDYSQYLHLDLG